MTYFPKDTYFSLLGEAYNIHKNSRSEYALWHWSNEQSGWGWAGDYPTYQDAFEMMLSIGRFTLVG